MKTGELNVRRYLVFLGFDQSEGKRSNTVTASVKLDL